MIVPSGDMTIRVPANSILYISPLVDGTGYTIQVISEEDGQILFVGRFGASEPLSP